MMPAKKNCDHCNKYRLCQNTTCNECLDDLRKSRARVHSFSAQHVARNRQPEKTVNRVEQPQRELKTYLVIPLLRKDNGRIDLDKMLKIVEAQVSDQRKRENHEEFNKQFGK